VNLDRELANHLAQSHPGEAARILERLDVDVAVGTLCELEVASAHVVLSSMGPRRAATVLEALPSDVAVRLLDEAPTNVTVWLLRRLPADRCAQLMEGLEGGRARRVARALRSRDGTAGALADYDALAFPSHLTVQEALDLHREALIGVRHPIPVVNEDHRLLGMASLDDLRTSPRSKPLTALMRAATTAIPSSLDRVNIVGLPAWRDSTALPVVDGEGTLLGLLHQQLVRDVETELRAAYAPPTNVTSRALGEVYGVGVGGFLEALVSFSAGAPRNRG
jgi:magnesium transporter